MNDLDATHTRAHPCDDRYGEAVYIQRVDRMMPVISKGERVIVVVMKMNRGLFSKRKKNWYCMINLREQKSKL